MPVTRVGVVYSAAQQVIRRIIDHRIELDANGNRVILSPNRLNARDQAESDSHHRAALRQGEVWASIAFSDYDRLPDHQAIHDHLGLTGIAGVTDRHAVVDRHGNVVAVVHGDPAVDTHPAGQLVPHATALVGGTFINGVYAPLVSAGVRS